MRAGLFLVVALATTGISYPALTPMPIKLLWNASASAPIGFYTIDIDGPFDVTDLVAVDAHEDEHIAALARHGFEPLHYTWTPFRCRRLSYRRAGTDEPWRWLRP